MNYWKRYISITIGDKVYTSPFTLSFSSDFNMKGSGTTARIFNPSDETIELVRAKGIKDFRIYQTISIDAGYEDDHGICVSGVIVNHTVSTSGTDRILELKIQDLPPYWENFQTNRTWQKYVPAAVIILELVLMLGLGIGKIEPGINMFYPRGLAANTSLKGLLRQLAKETESDFFIRNQKIYFLSKYSLGIRTGVSLTPSTGLIGKPAESNEGLKIQSLFNYKIGPGEYVHVESENYYGDYKVIRGSHNYTDEQAYTEMVVKEV